MKQYHPPFSITNQMLDLVSSIMEKVGNLDHYDNLNKMPILRKNNQICSIHSSLAIEANSLSLNQVKDVIDGKFVIGEQKEIQEVKNAYKAYNTMEDLDPYSMEDLKKIHGVLTYLTVDESGVFRKGNEGVFDGDKCIFMAPKPEMVEPLMSQLFVWMENNKEQLHPLILSSIFHYELVFIHPFCDGNGRTARLWQNVILSNWKGIFSYVPIESQLRKYQEDYYRAIDRCNKAGNSNEFIEFMLKMIDEVLAQFVKSTNQEMYSYNKYVKRLLEIMDYNIPMSANEIMEKLGIKSKETLRNTYLDPAIKSGLIKRTIPDKATSKNQMYYKV